ncbi:MAG: UrcA family protein [Proteobacteria bacterium]|nr:UrcA family protein [Pseudomonadota bacterium]
MGRTEQLARRYCWILLAPLALPGVSAAADPARAAPHRTAAPARTPAPEAQSIRISYRDLDVTTPQGVAALYLRVRHAAEDVCGARQAPTGTRLLAASTDACVRSTVRAAVHQIGVPGLAALEAEQQALHEAAVPDRSLCDAPRRVKIII